MAEEEREILTLREASEFLNCHPSTVYRLVKSSQIPAFRLGGSWRFVKPELRRWIKDLTEWPGQAEERFAASSKASSTKAAKPSPASRRNRISSSSADAAAIGNGRRLRRRK
jgi:excisionase family DNA binding protein